MQKTVSRILNGAGLLAGVSLLALIDIHGATAQQADQPVASASDGIEEVVVTARRREERVQTVPVAITAFSQQDLVEHHIERVQDLTRAVPSLGTSQTQSDANAPYASQLNLRGLAGTVIYFAGVPLGSGDGNNQGLTHASGPGYYYDLDHVEIDKGPQGTLFGKNSIGGLISLEPKRPTNNFEGYAEVTLGDYNDREFEGAVNVPIISDKLMVRIAGQADTRDGYTKVQGSDKNLDDVNYQAWRVGVTVRPTDDFENYLLYDGYWQHSNGSSTILYSVDPNHVLSTINEGGGHLLPVTLTGSGPVPGGAALGYLPTRYSLYPTLTSLLAQQQALGVRTEIGRVPPGLGKDYFYGFTDIATWDLSDAFTIKNIAAARVTKSLGTSDDSGTALPILTVGDPVNPHGWEENSVQYSEELQLQGKSLNDRLSWVAGGYLDFDHPLGANLVESEAAGALTQAQSHNSSRSQAAFIHGIYDLGDYVEGLRFTAGYRYTWDFVSVATQNTKVTDTVTRNAAGAPTNCTNLVVDNNCVSAANAHYSAPGWNVSLDEQLTEHTLLYVRSGNAYRPGGLNFLVPPPFQEYKPEHVTDVELGIKSDWELLGVKARTNFDAFHTDYKSIQVSQLVLVPTAGGGTPRVNTITTNAASAELEGVEFDATFVPIEGLEISPQFSYVYSHYGQYPATAGLAANPPFLYFPKTKYAVTGTYHLPVDAALGDISLTGIYSFYGQQYDSNLTAEPYNIIPSHDQFDIRVDWANIMGSTFDAAFFMTNVTNNTYVTGAYPIYAQFGFEALTYNAPRMFGITMKYRFGGASEETETAAAYTPPPVVTPAAAMPKSYLVFFDFNKSDLTPQALTIVDQAARNAAPAKVTKLEVTGHTDTVGSDAYNMRLSRRRAESVAAELEKKGIPSSEIEIVAKGKRDLLVPTADGVKEPQNRRVQIVYEDGAAS
jgi:iron complex outermembrane receptor protein